MPPLQNLNPEWQKVIRELLVIASKINHGEVVIKIHEGKASVTEYTVKRLTQDNSAFTVVGILD